MKERPILFTGEMVRAILDGRKTQMRRPVKPQPNPVGSWLTEGESRATMSMIWCEVPDIERFTVNPKWHKALPQFGAVGDRLWVRETFRIYRSFIECACYDDCQCASMNGKPLYRASDPLPDYDKWTPSIHMPRWASRIDLEITAVRVERVQDITEEDAKKEGMTVTEYYAMSRNPNRSTFIDLWQSIYGTWDANPWVWVYEFRRVKP